MGQFDENPIVQQYFMKFSCSFWYRNVIIVGEVSERTSVLFEDSMGEDPLSLLFQSFMLYLAGPVCPASHQSLTKFWLTLPIVAGVPVFV